jgi:hypothetical protein
VIYPKYYGWKLATFLLASFYATMVAAGQDGELGWGPT